MVELGDPWVDLANLLIAMAVMVKELEAHYQFPLPQGCLLRQELPSPQELLLLWVVLAVLYLLLYLPKLEQVKPD